MDGGRIIFNEQPNIDPMAIINLIQKQPNMYKMDGSNKLRIIKSLPDMEARSQTLKSLLELLDDRQAA